MTFMPSSNPHDPHRHILSSLPRRQSLISRNDSFLFVCQILIHTRRSRVHLIIQQPFGAVVHRLSPVQRVQVGCRSKGDAMILTELDESRHPAHNMLDAVWDISQYLMRAHRPRHVREAFHKRTQECTWLLCPLV